MIFADHLNSGIGVTVPVGPLSRLFGVGDQSEADNVELGGNDSDSPPPLSDYIDRLGRMTGRRILDVGAGHGEAPATFVRHGAKEVVATGLSSLGDMDLVPGVRTSLTDAELAAPPSVGAASGESKDFRLVACHPYDLDAMNLGRFDVVHCADQLRRATDPARITENLRAVTEGAAVLCERYDPDLDRFQPSDVMEYVGVGVIPRWWRFGQGTLCQLLRDAGFERVRQLATLRDDNAADLRDRLWGIFHAE